MSWRACAVCGKPANFSCSGCKITHYCGKDHQRDDWKATHKSTCKPAFRLETNETYGRYLVADRDIQQGELIFQEPPLIKGPKAFSSAICLGCHKQIGSSHWPCDGCGYPLCSVQCQVADAHFDECQIMMKYKYRANFDANSASPAHYNAIVPMRIMLMKEKYPDKFKKIMSLESHLKDRINTPLYNAYKKNVVEFLSSRLGFATFDENTILSIAGILDTNAFDIRLPERKLRGLYNTASMMAHNCVPNVRHTFHGPEDCIAVSAIVDIPAGTPIFATYTQPFWSTIARRKHLLESKGFVCTCVRCSDPTELGSYIGAFRCSRCATKNNYEDGPKMVSSDPLNDDALWHCPTCEHRINAKLVKAGNENLKQELSRLDKSSPTALEQFLEKYGVESSGILHPKNSFVVQVKHALVQMYGNRPGLAYADLSEAALKKKIEYCHDLLDIAEILTPGFSRFRGEILGELQASMVMLSKVYFNEGKITREATQDTLRESMLILAQVVEIMKNEPDFDALKSRLEQFAQELD